MGERKKKKEKRSPQKKVSTGGRDVKPQATWPNLPISVETKNWQREDFIRSNASRGGGITKSWVSPPSCNNQRESKRRAWPQLVQRFTHQHQVTMCSDRDIPTYWYEYGYGLRGDSNVHFRRAVVSGRTTMIITGLASPAFAFSRMETIYDGCYYRRCSWTMKNCRVVEPYSATDHQYMEFTNAIGIQGKFYAISRQGSLALIEGRENSGDYEITRLGRNRAVPCKPSRHFREYLLKYKEEIFLVLLLSEASVNTVDGVEIFRLDGSRLCWEKIERLPDDAVFFVEDKCCLGISAAFLGCQGASNCIYFTHDRVGTWFCYDMKTGGVSTTDGPVIHRPIY